MPSSAPYYSPESDSLDVCQGVKREEEREKAVAMPSSSSFACLETCGARMREVEGEEKQNSSDASEPLDHSGSDESETSNLSEEDANPIALPRKLNARSLRTFDYKASGHHLMFRTNDGKIAKESTHEEERFYTCPEGKHFSEFTAQYAGTGYLMEEDIKRLVDRSKAEKGELVEPAEPMSPSAYQKRKKFILLRDVINGFQKPCVLDIKMGVRGYGLNATALKRRNKMRKTLHTTSATLGFRIHGMRMYDHREEDYRIVDKHYGRALCIETMAEFLSQFFITSSSGEPNPSLVNVFISRLTQLTALFENQELFHFYTSSLLLYFDSARPAETADIRMIDFAFTYPVRDIAQVEHVPSRRDEGYLFGLRNLTKLLHCVKSSLPFTPHTGHSIHPILFPGDAPADV